ncbi:hypothetical protein [Actinacidiphila soli]|nr:hypothetical protein [Actinacidiphila soli]
MLKATARGTLKRQVLAELTTTAPPVPHLVTTTLPQPAVPAALPVASR